MLDHVAHRGGVIPELSVEDEHAGRAVSGDANPVGRVQPVVECDAAKPRRADAEVSLDVGVLVRLEVEHPITCFEAEATQAARKLHDPRARLAEGHHALGPVQGNAIAIVTHGA